MSLAVVHSRAEVGISAPEVLVEVHISRGLPSFSIVGLPETAVKESRDRVRGAIINSKFEFPNNRISVNLAPADLPKVGGRFDLPIAIGVLAASAQIPLEALKDKVFLGELALSGKLREITGSVISAQSLTQSGLQLVLPEMCMEEATLVSDVTIVGVKTLSQLTAILHGKEEFPTYLCNTIRSKYQYPDMQEVVGQPFAKFALEVAASGNHNILLMGSPGTGKTMLASRLPGILPEMTNLEALEIASINSVSNNQFNIQNWKERPFRSPHHGASGVALIGGGSIPKPGEISLAHNGVLFLDELTEFDRRALDLLREPLESGYVNISRAAMQIKYPAQFLLVAACNLCKCGYLGDPSGSCRCSPEQIQRYLSKLSGPLLDRIDIQINVPRMAPVEMRDRKHNTESTAQIKQKVIRTRNIQYQRQGKLNCKLSPSEMEKCCQLDERGYHLLDNAIEKFRMSNRAYHRILKVARTIADIQCHEKINQSQLSVAIKMRCMDKSLMNFKFN